MTHDELLAEIDFLPLDGLHKWFQPALRAVVELHKATTFEDDELGDMILCSKCITAYPCPTIQVIEKELR
jgi:hypothetical protein